MDVHENAIVVPKKALVIEKGGAYVFVVRKDLIVEKRFVELGPEVENRVVVERGLGVDEMIIVEGFHKLSQSRRPIEPEAVFGQIKYDSHFKRFSYRGKRLVNAEFAAIAVAHNIRKMIAKGYCVCSEVAVG